nr:MAG TPA: hypothetical protein [Bacteriophage sp.]
MGVHVNPPIKWRSSSSVVLENHGAVAAFSLKFVLDNHIILW